jgi:hypothetical protein
MVGGTKIRLVQIDKREQPPCNKQADGIGNSSTSAAVVNGEPSLGLRSGRDLKGSEMSMLAR